jgi:putative membrane-bound dehydrogenase-like protein
MNRAEIAWVAAMMLASSAALAEQHALTPAEAARTFRVADGFKVEQFAAEPHLASPVSISFDADGKAYVAEMLDYPFIRTEKMFGPFPEGQIRLVEDADGDGKVDKSTVFATGVWLPISVLAYDGGVLVAAAPDILFLKDTDGDGRADVRQVVLTGFDISQDLYRVNGLLWGVDGWIYARGVGDTPIHWGDDPTGPALSTRGMNFRFKPKEKKFEAVSGMSSCVGLTSDDWGHLFFTNSAEHVYQVVLPREAVSRNRNLVAPPAVKQIPDHGGITPIFRASPPQEWRVARTEQWKREGLEKKFFGTIEGRPDYTTAVTGPHVYRETLFPPEFRGNYFCCEAVGNLIHRDVLTGDGPVYTAKRAASEQKSEFLASTDPWCSPVEIKAGPDGALYVVDMYRQIIEHPGPDGGRDVPNVPLEILRKYGMRAGSTMGRVYRVGPKGTPPMKRPQLGKATAAQLAAHLGDEAGWWRDTAQRLILQSLESADVKAIEAVAAGANVPAARAQALYTLDALGKLESRHVLAALADKSPGVREAALRLAGPRLGSDAPLLARALELSTDENSAVRFQLALALGQTSAPERIGALATVAVRNADDPYTRAAVFSSAGDGVALFGRLLRTRVQSTGGGERLVLEAARLIGAGGDAAGVDAVLAALGEEGHDYAEWVRLSTLRGLAEGLKLSGAKGLKLSAGSETLTAMLGDASEPVHQAAAALARHVRMPGDAQGDAARDALVQSALKVAADGTAPPAKRRDAARDLAAGPFERVAPVLAELLDVRNPDDVQRAALASLDAQADPGVVAILVGRWNRLTPSLKADALRVALARRERIGPFLDALGKGAVPPAEIDAESRSRLLNQPDADLAARAKAVFEAQVKSQDAQLLEKFKPALQLRGDGARGRELFHQRCATCHQLGGDGVAVGPDLGSVRAQGAEQVLANILYPSATVLPNYAYYVLEAEDGAVSDGIIAASDEASVTLRRAKGEETTVLRRHVKKLTRTRASLMPEGLLDGLGPQDAADLLQFIKAGA